MERAGLARYATIYFVAATSSRKAAGKYFTMQAGSVHALVRMGMVLGHRIDAKISPKAASEKAQTTVSENTYTYPNIDVFRTAILSILAATGNNARASFLVHQVPRTSATVLWYGRMFTQFSLRV